MITLHPAGATGFSTLGFGPLSELISGNVVEEINGMYELTMSYPVGGARYKDIKQRAIIYAKPTPYSKPQPFRIYAISKPMNRQITINAAHISYDLSGYPVDEFKADNPQAALSELKLKSHGDHPFAYTTNSSETGTIKVESPRSSRSVLGNNFLSAYGGEFEFDTFTVRHVTKRGRNRGAVIRYGKNMLDMNQEENITEVYTHVYPYWIGTEVDTDKTITVKLPERTLAAEGTFDFKRILPLDMGEYFDKPPSEKDMRDKATKYMKDKKIGVPKVSLEVSFVQLSKSAENLANELSVIDRVELGDTLGVYFEDLGVDSTARCIKTTYNLVTGKYDSVELGDSKTNLSSTISSNNQDMSEQIGQQVGQQLGQQVGQQVGQHLGQQLGQHIGPYIEDLKIWSKANFAHMTDGIIDNATMGPLTINTGHLQDESVTVHKIQHRFMDDIVQMQGKLLPSHIDILSSENLDENTLTKDHMTMNVIEAINMRTTGKIATERLDLRNLDVGDINADNITTGTLNADRIAANSIDANKLTISDFTNLATSYQNKEYPNKEYPITNSIERLSHETPIGDITNKDEFWFDVNCKTETNSVNTQLKAGVHVKYTDNTWTFHEVVLGEANECRDWIRRTTTIKLDTIDQSRTPIMFQPVLGVTKQSSDVVNNWIVRNVIVRRKFNGKLVVDGTIEAHHIKAGSITTDKLDAKAITAEHITAEVIKAINMSAEQIDAKNINTDNLKVNGSLIAGDISADSIKAEVISAINNYTGTAKIKLAHIEDLRVGNANIIDLDASKITTGKISADRIDAANLQVKFQNVTGTLTASKIVGGVLDASQMTVRNLRADSITAGSLTIDGDNLLRNSGWLKDSSKWTLGSGWNRSNTKHDNFNTMTATSANNSSLESEHILCDSPGSKYVATVYTMSPDIDSVTGVSMDIVFYNNSTIVNHSRIPILPNSSNSWQRFMISSDVPNTANRISVRFNSTQSGTISISKPMLQRGSIASEFKVHVDEQISDGAIDSDKLGQSAVTPDKINIPELFVTGSAFINNLRAVEIDAAQITTGKIQGERIDINGLVSFEAFDTTLQPIFNSNGGKTYINGGMIATNTIKADSIDLLSGLTVRGLDNTTTFAIASDGTVEVNGLLRSGNYDNEKKTGYQISQDGTAVLNQATIRGKVVLPNAGMTNDFDQNDVGNPVRIWAGSSYELRDSAPFRVMQNGDVYAYNARLTGILYGSVDSGFVNIYEKELSIVDDTRLPNVEYVRLNPDISMFNTDVVIGDDVGRLFHVSKSTRTITVKNGSMILNGDSTNVSYNPANNDTSGLNFTGKINSGHHVLRYTDASNMDGTLTFDSLGNQGIIGDFCFTRKNFAEDVRVDIRGSLSLKRSIKSDIQNIEIRSVAGEGWGFYVV